MPASNQIRHFLSPIFIQLADVKVIYSSSCHIRIIFSRDNLIYPVHVLFGQYNFIDWINIYYNYMITDQRIYFFLVPDSCCATMKKNANKRELHRGHQQNTIRLTLSFALVRNIGSSPSVAIFQHRVYNWYVILELVPSTVSLWIEFGC
jgi:hypothetical protein